MKHRLMLVVTEDWYLWSHRIGLAVAARDAGRIGRTTRRLT